MTLEDYLANGFTDSERHETEVDGLKVICLNSNCDFEEYFPTFDDAQVGSEVHSS